MLKTVNIIVEGLVQGVYYRQSTKEKALELGVSGQVCNRYDGTVQIIATGSRQQIQELIDWCRKGPKRANVTDLKVEEIPTKAFDKFEIIR